MNRDCYILKIQPKVLAEDEPKTLGSKPILISDDEPSTEQVMRAIGISGVLDFWDSPEEDIYTEEDGAPA